jgi:hypothetical protein
VPSRADELRDAVADHRLDVRELSIDEAARTVARFTDAFVAQPTATWWWDHLRGPSVSLHYGAAPNPGLFGLACALRIVGDPDARVLMVVTADDQIPRVFGGPMGDVVRALEECPAFEFVITDHDASWAIFDTHHDVLVVSGTPPGAAQIEILQAEIQATS